MINEHKKWQTPKLEVLNIEETMASTTFSGEDEGYNAALGNNQTGPHHGS